MRKASVRRALRPVLTLAPLASGNLPGGHTGNITFDALGERGAHVALRADEPNQHIAAARVHLMNGIGPHPKAG